MKKLLISLGLVVGFIAGCGGGDGDNQPNNHNQNQQNNQNPQNNQNYVASDSHIFIKENNSAKIKLQSNGLEVKISSVLHGNAIVDGDNIVYTPTQNYSGTDKIVYSINNQSKEIDITIDPLVSFTINQNANFNTGQNADIVLGEAGFNNAGYLTTPNDGLLFNHAKGIDSDDKHLLLADGNNNRILIWNSLPTGNVSPDIVLGQTNFTTNNTGSNLNQMNFPTSVATDGTRVFVTDAHNDRVLVWNTFPTHSGQSADFEIKSMDLIWPWGVWSDGNKLIVTSTFGRKVLVWNTIPTVNTPYDYSISSNGEMGTPRAITTDGSSFLIVGDHNPNRAGLGQGQGSFFWNTFPTSDTRADGFMQDFSKDKNYAWLQGDVTKEGKLFLYSRWLYAFDTIPTTATQAPTNSFKNYSYNGGDGSDVVAVDSNSDGVDDKLYISTYNGNKIVGFNSIPTSNSSVPDFVIGSRDKDFNELVDANHHRGNPVPVSTEQQLFVLSDFDRKLSVWNSLPTTDNQPPSFEIDFRSPKIDSQPNSLSIVGNKLLAYAQNEKKLFIWSDGLPNSAVDMPDLIYSGSIGGIPLGEDVTFDDKYLYLIAQNKLYVWDISTSLPSASSHPNITINLNNMGSKVTTDGNYLTITNINTDEYITIFKISDIQTNGSAATVYATIKRGANIQLNLPSSARTYGDKLFVVDGGFNRVLIWNTILKANNGDEADTIIGQNNINETKPKKAKNGLFWPYHIHFNGRDLWIGEYKFSGRLVRFRPN
jgi:hypothetical protein